MSTAKKIWSGDFFCGSVGPAVTSAICKDGASVGEWLDAGAFVDDRDDCDDSDLSEYSFYLRGSTRVYICSEFLDEWFHGDFGNAEYGREITVELWGGPVPESVPVAVDTFVRNPMDGVGTCTYHDYVLPDTVYAGEKFNAIYTVSRQLAARLYKIICHDNNMHHAWLKVLS